MIRPLGLSLAASLLFVGAASSGVASAQTSLSSASRTIVVKPVGTNAQNGAALLAAVASVSPTNASPYLIKIQPGTYDVGTSTLFMKPYLDIEGSGIDITRIEGLAGVPGNFGEEVVSGADNAEIRELTIKAFGSAARPEAIAFQNRQTSPTLRQVKLVAKGADSGPRALRNIGGTPVLEFVTLTATGSGTSPFAWGIVNRQGSRPTIKFSSITAKGASSNYGIFNNEGSAPVSIIDTTILAQGGVRAYGYDSVSDFPGRNTEVLRSKLTAIGASVENVGFRSDGPATAIVTTSELSGFGAGGIGIDVTQGEVRLHQSTAAGGSIRAQAFTLNVASSWLRGAGIVQGVTENCAGVWNAAYVFFPNTCP